MNKTLSRQLICKQYQRINMQKYKQLTLAITKKGKALLYNDPDMPAIKALNPEIEQTFHLPSVVAIKGLLRDYQGKGVIEVQNSLKEALKLF